MQFYKLTITKWTKHSNLSDLYTLKRSIEQPNFCAIHTKVGILFYHIETNKLYGTFKWVAIGTNWFGGSIKLVSELNFKRIDKILLKLFGMLVITREKVRQFEVENDYGIPEPFELIEIRNPILYKYLKRYFKDAVNENANI